VIVTPLTTWPSSSTSIVRPFIEGYKPSGIPPIRLVSKVWRIAKKHVKRNIENVDSKTVMILY